MSYHIYTTPGIILKRKNFGEADTLFHILTRDLGLILASARSSRLMSSKLRGFLQDYSEVSLSCLKSKNGWKITNVSSDGSTFSDYPEYSKKILSQVSTVLIKMIQGELANKELYEIVRSGFFEMTKTKESDIRALEILMVLRILNELGYVVKTERIEKFLDGRIWESKLLQEAEIERIHTVEVINRAIKESHL